ncbi:MAG: RteC domain-containing protein [Bacteroidales bacterium]
MNEALVFINEIFYSQSAFERHIKTEGISDIILNPPIKDIYTKLEIIENENRRLNNIQSNELHKRIRVFIAKIDTLISDYINERDYYFEKIYEGPDWGLLAGIEDETESQEYYKKTIESFDNMRDLKVQRCLSIMGLLSQVKTALLHTLEVISINQIKMNDFDNSRSVISSLTWEVYDTDLLELVTALVESGSIQNSTKSLTRKEAIAFFCEIFSLEIKDSESKLSRATERIKEVSPFLTKLKNSFDQYAKKKDER